MTKEQIHIGSMSHEGAINILKLMIGAMEMYDAVLPTPERINAMKMAIEALEQEPVSERLPKVADHSKKSITNREKFRKVFGVDISTVGHMCHSNGMCGSWWDKEYKDDDKKG